AELILDWAVEDKYISANPMKKMKRQVKVVRSKVQEFLTEDERERVLAAEAPLYVKLILFLGFFAGLRDGEMLACAPHWIWISDDGCRGTLSVQDQVITYQNGKKGLWKPKVRHVRTIPLHPRLLAFLKENGIQKPWLLRPDKELWPDPGMNSKRFDAHKALNSLAKKAGVKKLNYHILRHTFATLLVMKGVSLADVAGLLGDTLKVTEDHYAGYSPNKVSPVDLLQAPERSGGGSFLKTAGVFLLHDFLLLPVGSGDEALRLLGHDQCGIHGRTAEIAVAPGSGPQRFQDVPVLLQQFLEERLATAIVEALFGGKNRRDHDHVHAESVQQ
ncbi:MAG: site-specific integrase, partial [Verrucomicrobiaceae bacterium]